MRGVDLPLWTVYAGIALWSVGAVGFIRPVRYGLQILLVGGTVLMLLRHFDGTIVLISKMCTYCLLLSIVWTLEPCWDPHIREWYQEEGHSKSENAIEKQAELGEGLLLVQNDIEHKENRATVVAHHHQHPHRIPLNLSATVVKIATA